MRWHSYGEETEEFFSGCGGFEAASVEVINKDRSVRSVAEKYGIFQTSL